MEKSKCLNALHIAALDVGMNFTKNGLPKRLKLGTDLKDEPDSVEEGDRILATGLFPTPSMEI